MDSETVFREIKSEIFESEKIKPGGIIHGPAVIEVKDTTIYLPTDTVLSKDQYINYRIKLAEKRKLDG